MKKKLALLPAASMLLTLAGCGNSDSDDSKEKADSSVSNSDTKDNTNSSESGEKVDIEASTSTELLKEMNSSAKMAYAYLNSELVEMITNGKSFDGIDGGYHAPIKVGDLDDSDPLQSIIKYWIKGNAYDPNKAEDYYVSWEVDIDEGSTVFVQVSSTIDEGIVGQYPDAEEDPSAKHTIGTKF